MYISTYSIDIDNVNLKADGRYFGEFFPNLTSYNTAGFPCPLPDYETFVYHVRDYYVQNHYKLCEQNTD